MVSCPSGCGQSDVVISGEHVQQLAIHTTEFKDYIYIYIRRVAKNKMAVQKLHEFCEAEKRKIFALWKIIVQGKTLKKILQVSKLHLLHRNEFKQVFLNN